MTRTRVNSQPHQQPSRQNATALQPGGQHPRSEESGIRQPEFVEQLTDALGFHAACLDLQFRGGFFQSCRENVHRAGKGRVRVGTPVAPGANTVVVGHGYPYYTLVGGQYLSEGEADVLRPRGTDFAVLARVGLAQWRALAAVPAGR